MKYLTLGSISALFLLAADTSAVSAQGYEQSANNDSFYLSQYEEPELLDDEPLDEEPVEVGELVDEYETSPFELVTLARRGYLENQGIPAYGAFEDSVDAGEIEVDEIIQAAIDAGRLAPVAYDDEGYEFAVRLQLRALDDDLL